MAVNKAPISVGRAIWGAVRYPCHDTAIYKPLSMPYLSVDIELELCGSQGCPREQAVPPDNQAASRVPTPTDGARHQHRT